MSKQLLTNCTGFPAKWKQTPQWNKEHLAAPSHFCVYCDSTLVKPSDDSTPATLFLAFDSVDMHGSCFSPIDKDSDTQTVGSAKVELGINSTLDLVLCVGCGFKIFQSRFGDCSRTWSREVNIVELKLMSTLFLGWSRVFRQAFSRDEDVDSNLTVEDHGDQEEEGKRGDVKREEGEGRE